LAREVILEAFLTDSIIISVFTPQIENKEVKLNFSEFQVLPIDEIELITYSIKHRGRAFWSGFILIITGADFAILPVVMPLLIGNSEEMYSKPSFPYTIASGVVLYIIGRQLLKSLRPREYNLIEDWQYKVIN
jgi:hypothetical protein